MRWTAVVVAMALAALLAPGCAGGDGVTVILDEYAVEPDPSTEASGEVTFTVRNEGKIAHEFLVLRTEEAFDELPVSEGGVVPLDSDGIETLEEIPIIAPGGVEPVSVELDPGEYALICNIAGHYPSGMRASFRVP